VPSPYGDHISAGYQYRGSGFQMDSGFPSAPRIWPIRPTCVGQNSTRAESCPSTLVGRLIPHHTFPRYVATLIAWQVSRMTPEGACNAGLRLCKVIASRVIGWFAARIPLAPVGYQDAIVSGPVAGPVSAPCRSRIAIASCTRGPSPDGDEQTTGPEPGLEVARLRFGDADAS
jgi:hypothetical protein